jgi:hypothetical protein
MLVCCRFSVFTSAWLARLTTATWPESSAAASRSPRGVTAMWFTSSALCS